MDLGKALTSVADSHDSSSLVGFSNNLVVATQIFFIFTPNPWGNDPIWRSYFSNGVGSTTNSKTWWNKSVFVKSLICKKLWGFVLFNPYRWRSLYDYVVVEYGIFFSGYQTRCMLGVGSNWRFGRCFGISRPWARYFAKKKGTLSVGGHWNGNPMFPSKRKKNLRTKSVTLSQVIWVKLPQRRAFSLKATCELQNLWANSSQGFCSHGEKGCCA